MLVATVVPCSTRASDGAARSASASASRMPVRKACDGSLGTDGVLARQMRPLEASCRAMSVKVPPMSTATASDESAVMDARVLCHPERSEGSHAGRNTKGERGG
jgi:hypothetical protein